MLCATMLLTSPSISEAATHTASNLDKLAQIVRKYSLKRKGKFNVRYTGKDKDLDSLFDLNGGFFDSMISLLDDPSTSNDADVLVGNYKWDRDDSVVWNPDTGIIKFNLRFYDNLKQMKYVNRKIKTIVKKLGVKKMSNYNKVKTFYKYLAKTITYPDPVTDKDYEYSMYGALKKRKAVCNAYAMCMYKLCVEAGVPCKYIGGTYTNSKGKKYGHAWNIVALGDKWYNLDLTWDDDDYFGEVAFDYFLKGSSDFDAYERSVKHTMDKPYRTGEFKKNFPIAKKKFNPNTMSDKNKKIKIGGKRKVYSYKDILSDIYPSSRKFTVKRGKIFDLQLQLKDGKDKLVKRMDYEIVSGRSYLKSVTNYGMCYDKSNGSPFTDLELKGGKKGNVAVKLILVLKNGQKFIYNFAGKVV